MLRLLSDLITSKKWWECIELAFHSRSDNSRYRFLKPPEKNGIRTVNIYLMLDYITKRELLQILE